MWHHAVKQDQLHTWPHGWISQMHSAERGHTHTTNCIYVNSQKGHRKHSCVLQATQKHKDSHGTGWFLCLWEEGVGVGWEQRASIFKVNKTRGSLQRQMPIMQQEPRNDKGNSAPEIQIQDGDTLPPQRHIIHSSVYLFTYTFMGSSEPRAAAPDSRKRTHWEETQNQGVSGDIKGPREKSDTEAGRMVLLVTRGW